MHAIIYLLFFFFLCVKNNWICFKQYIYCISAREKNNNKFIWITTAKHTSNSATMLIVRKVRMAALLRASAMCARHSALWQTGTTPLSTRGCNNTHIIFNSLFIQLHLKHTTVDMRGQKQTCHYVNPYVCTQQYCILIQDTVSYLMALCLMSCCHIAV